jgi:hypothetical protein
LKGNKTTGKEKNELDDCEREKGTKVKTMTAKKKKTKDDIGSVKQRNSR